MMVFFSIPLKLILSGLLSLLLGLLALWFAVWTGVFGPLPPPGELAGITHENASLVYSGDGHLIGKVFAENRTSIKEYDIPEHLVKALVITEDKRFYDHHGIDARGYARAFVKTLLLRLEGAGGGSTLTQQLVKNLYPRGDYYMLSILINKTREAIIARRLEKIYSKDEIIVLYLNSVPFGENTYGIEAAARRYFNKTTSDLALHESTLLVAMLKANTSYNPRLYPEAATRRRNLVAGLMAKAGYLTDAQRDSLQELPLGLDYTNYKIYNPSGHFVHQVRKQAKQILSGIRAEDSSEYHIEKDGLSIYTTLDLELQFLAVDAIRHHLSIMQRRLDRELAARGTRSAWEREYPGHLPDGAQDTAIFRPVFRWYGNDSLSMTWVDSLWHYYRMLNAATLVMEPGSGKVRAWVGGNHYRYLPYDLVTAARPAASAFKPFLYAAALEQGLGPCDYFNNEELVFEEYDNWRPANYDGSSGGEVAMWYARSHSMNLPTVDLYFRTGHEMLRQTCQGFGLDLPAAEMPAIALGAREFSLLDLVGAYTAFAHHGERSTAVMIERILDQEGNEIYRWPGPRGNQAVQSGTATTINQMLAKAVNEGTGKALRNSYNIRADIAGKTGTSQEYSDAWFIAYDEGLVYGTWGGAMTPDIHFLSGRNGSGSALALPVVGSIIREIERTPSLNERYLAGFSQSDASEAALVEVDENLFDCEPTRTRSMLDEFIEDVFTPDKKSPGTRVEEPAEKKKKKEGKFKRFFKNLFKKKDK